MELQPGAFTIVTGDSSCSLAGLFYESLGLLESSRGPLQSDGEAVRDLLARGVSIRGASVAVVDPRSAPPHERTVLEHVAGAVGGDREEAAAWLATVGVGKDFHDYLPAHGPSAEGGRGRKGLYGFDPDRKRFHGLLEERPALADGFLIQHRIPMPIYYPYQERPDVPPGGDPAEAYRAREEEMRGATRAVLVANHRAMDEATYGERLSRYHPVQRRETAWFFILKLAEIARALAARPRWFWVLDSCDCAGQKNLAPFYDHLVRWTSEEAGEERRGVVGAPAIPGLRASPRGLRPLGLPPAVLATGGECLPPGPPLAACGVVLFAPGRLGPFDDLGVRVTRRDEDPHAGYAKPRFSGAVADKKTEERGVEFKIRNLSHSYDRKTWIVRNVDLDFAPAKTMVVMGGSGCGKSTILRLAAGLEVPSEGLVMIRDKGWSGEKVKPNNERRKEMGVLFQGSALFQSMSVAQNVAAPILEHTRLDPNVVDIMVSIKLGLVEMMEHREKMPYELSGGQMKRAGLARALALDPGAIFYDEPSAGLDPIVSGGIDVLMNKLGEVLGVTSIIITHELESAFTIADRMVVLRKAEPEEDEYWIGAQRVAQGNPAEIKACIHPHVIQFLREFGGRATSPLANRRSWFREPGPG
ncbi:MAG: ATP-binding cassette domain-containing protein [Planctomycetes bacterium]|nr:ATP-binding cassette domain-containing protein [Planctomycetota bacterium]